MWFARAKLICAALIAVAIAGPALSAEMKSDAINSAEPSTKTLSTEKATPAGVRLQVLLDRAHFSLGEMGGSPARLQHHLLRLARSQLRSMRR